MRTITVLFLLGVSVTAQVSRSAASLTIIVTDESGAILPGAGAEISNQDSGQKRTTATGQDGRSVVTNVSPGTYIVRVSAKGFAVTETRNVQLGLGRQTILTVKLNPEAVTQQITVSSEPPIIDPGQTSVATSIDKERIEESPVVSRNYLDFVLLAPGLTSSNQQSRTSTVTPLVDSGFSFAGQRSRSNVLYIDGVENNDEFTGATRTELSLELIREFQVVNNGLAAEAGGGSGGSINVITRSGANILHGDAFVFLQNGALNAREPFLIESAKPDSNKVRVGFAIGGPIVRDKTFFYVAGEQERNSDEASSAINPGSAATLSQILATTSFSQLRNEQLDPGLSPVRRAETEASGRLDQQLGSSNLTLRYSFNNNREAGDAFNSGGLNAASVRGSSFTEDHTGVAGLTSILSASLVNDSHLQISTRRAVLRPNDTFGPEFDIVGLARFGHPYEGNSRRNENHYEVSDAVTISTKRHLIKFGADVDNIHENLQSFDGLGGLYTFLTPSDLAIGNPFQYRQRFGLSGVALGVTKAAGFVQDHWTLGTRLTMDLGLRYDYEHLPKGFNQDLDNFAPRVGLAFSPARDWVLRGGFGIFYDRYPLAFLSQALSNNGESGFEQIFDMTSAVSVFQNTGGGSLASPRPLPNSIYRPEFNLRTSYSEQVNAGVEHVIFAKTSLTATYLFSRGVHLGRIRNINLAQPTVLTTSNAAVLGIMSPVPQQIGRPVFTQTIDPEVRDIFQLENRAGSVYHGGFLGIKSKLSSDFDLAASYTISNCRDTASDYYEQPENPYDLRAEQSPCSFDQRHRFVLSGVFELGEEEHRPDSTMWSRTFSHIELAPILTFGSSRPLDAVTGFDANLSHSFPLSPRPLGAGRNSLRSGKQLSIDLRLLKYFKIRAHGKLDLVAEGFNLTNHANVVLRQNASGASATPPSDFLRPILGSTARQFQFSIDYEF